MNRYEYRGHFRTIKELSELSGIAPPTLRDRLRRGYSVAEAVKIVPTNDSVAEFIQASYWKDWIGMSTAYLYEIYWKWCVSNQYTPTTKQGFSRHLFKLHPNLKTVSAKKDSGCYRVIRER